MRMESEQSVAHTKNQSKTSGQQLIRTTNGALANRTTENSQTVKSACVHRVLLRITAEKLLLISLGACAKVHNTHKIRLD